MENKDRRVSPKRKTSSPPEKSPARKRQRNPVKRFDIDEEVQKSARKRRLSGEILFERNSYVAVRADRGRFYLCQVLANVYSHYKSFKIRWLEIEEPPRTYKKAYEDTVELDCVIAKVVMTNHRRGLLRLDDSEANRVKKLLQAAEAGTDVTRLDVNLFSPSAKKAESPKLREPPVKRARQEAKPAGKPARGRKKVVSTKGRVTNKGKRTAKNNSVKPTTSQNGKPGLSRSRTLPVGKLGALDSTPKRALTKAKSLTLKKSVSISSQVFVAKSVLAKAVSVGRSKDPKKKEALKKAIKKVAKEGKKLIKDRNPKPNQRLVPNPDIEVPNKDPFFETKMNVPFVSTKAHSKLLIRAVKLKDHRMLRELINNSEQISSLEEETSVSRSDTPLHLAVKLQDLTAVRMLLDQYDSKKRVARAPATECMMSAEGTGRYNPLSLGIKKVRAMNVSRGGREGNNALAKDLEFRHDEEDIIPWAIKNDVSFDNLKILLTLENDQTLAFPEIYQAVRRGNRKLAAALVKYAENFGGYGFNKYHREALDFDGRETWKDIRTTSVTKKPNENKGITPIHCAAINPNEKYLNQLLSQEPEYNIEDADKWRPMHYAAVCQGPGPLKLLIKKGVQISECTKNFMTPLCLAALNGRLENVKVLVAHLIETYSDADPKMLKKYGPGFINKPMKTSWTPLHFAAYNGHLDVVAFLIENGADPNKKLSASLEGLSCLMIAAQMGYFDMVKYLVYHGSKIEQKDKYCRTALIHAVRDGNSRVAAYLLSRGANPNFPDSSGNTPMHYAAAYGWYFCLKLLLEAGANPDVPNMWKVTPLAASYQKGNVGLVSVLLDVPGINVDFQDDYGRTLVLCAVSTTLTTKVYEEVKLLVEQKSANLTLTDKRGRNFLHYVVCTHIPHSAYDLEEMMREAKNDEEKKKVEEKQQQQQEAKKVMEDLIDLGLKYGCDPNVTNDSKETPMLHLLYRGDVFWHLPLLEKLMGLSDRLLIEGAHTNPLAHFCRDVYRERVLDALKLLKNAKLKSSITGEEELRKMAKIRNPYDHRTPLIAACHSYHQQFSRTEALQKYRIGREVLEFVASFNDEIEYTYECEDKDSKKKTETMTAIFPLLLVNDAVDSSQLPKEIVNNDISLRPAFTMLTKGKTFNIDLPYSEGKPILFHYIAANEPDMIKFLLKHGANVNYVVKEGKHEGMTPLLTAVEQNNERVVELLLEHGADVKAVTKGSAHTALHLAVKKESLSMTQLLLKRGFDINAQCSGKKTVLHLVAEDAKDDDEACKDLEMLLLRSGADTLAKDLYGRIPLHYVFENSCGRAFDPVESYSNFAAAMKDQCLDVADNAGETPLHKAAKHGATVCCMLLLQRGCAINAKSKHGNTPLSYAVDKEHQSCVLMLMEKGADVSGMVITNPFADVPPEKKEEEINNDVEDEDVGFDDWYHDFNDASVSDKKRKQREKLMQALLKKKKKPIWKWQTRHFPSPWKPGEKGYPIFRGLVEKGWQGLTYVAMDLLKPFGMSFAAAIEIALKLKKYRFAKLLMDKQIDKTVFTEKNPQKQSLLHVLMQSSEESNLMLEEKILADLVAAGVKVSDQDSDGFTPLQYAAKNHLVQHVDSLLAVKDDKVMSARDKYGRSAIAALLWTLDNSDKYLEVLKNLIAADPAALNCHYDFCPVDTFLRAPKPHLQVSEYYVQYDVKVSPLIHAICNSQYEVVRVLLANGASVNLANKDGVTPLMYAVRMNDVHVVELLLHPNPADISLQKRKEKGAERREQIKLCNQQAPTFTEEDPLANIDRLGSSRKDQNYGAVDNHGWSVLHHMVNSTPLGAYQNLVMLRYLADAGVPLDVKDKHGLTPLQHAIERGATQLACAIQHLLGVPKADWKKATHTQPAVSDEITWEWLKADFTADAKDMMKEVEDKQMAVEEEFVPDPDPRAYRRGKSAKVVKNDEDGTYYDILMNKVDVRIGDYGLFNFYKMQVLYESEDDIFILFTCWGRIGDEGQYQKTPFSTKEAAVAEFCKIFKSKSGNEWSNLKNFQNQPRLYRLVDVLYRKKEQVPEVYFDLKSDLPSKLSPYVKDMVLEMSSVSMLKYMVKQTGVDIPFGCLKLESLKKAMDLLSEMSEYVEKKEEMQRDLKTDNLPEYHQMLEKLWQLSTEYYYLIPKSGHQFEKLRPLDHISTVNSAKNMIRNLLELEFANRLLLAAQHRIKEIHPLDYIYRALETQIALLSQSDPVVKLIMQYIYATAEFVDVEAIYAVSRSGEDERIAACKLDNRQMLWHGSSTSNLISILSRGLLVAPPDAPSTGMRFGKGIYSTNSFSLSHNYCRNDGGSNTRYMFLCEVALGKIFGVDATCVDRTEAPEGFNSVRANAHNIPDRNFNVMVPTGAILPIGPHIESDEPCSDPTLDTDQKRYHLCYREPVNQFIVYKPDQVALRYIVQYRH